MRLRIETWQKPPLSRPACTARRNRATALAVAPPLQDALRTAVESEHSTSELRHHLTHAEAAAHGGATAQENALLRRAADLLLRRDRGVGASTPSPPPRGPPWPPWPSSTRSPPGNYAA
ncbi:hypothetical protein ACIQPR_09100 [Streptomyces sp. NPDC091280]|uniref:hypothetical protein n=1 Tax=Streptomyces sp. NPDC091280 TaxID=3365984 RepID=UPI00381695A9